MDTKAEAEPGGSPIIPCESQCSKSSDSGKRKRKANLTSEVGSINCTDLNSFGGFMFKRILMENSQKKTVVVEGFFKDTDGVALVLLEKTPFCKKGLQDGFLNGSSTLSQEFFNDVYGNYTCQPTTTYNSIKATIIHPATDKHIKKFEPKTLHIVRETYPLYLSVTLPSLEKKQLDCQWVLNILDHKSESERILFENEDPEVGFILLPDMKWDGKLVENLYMVAIVHKQGIKSLRDLNADHLPLLKNIYNEGIAAIEEKYKLPGSQMRIFLHYQPSYYHLHVHFTNLKFDAPGIFAEKSHLLSSVINNIELQPDHYQKATLSFVVKEDDSLFDAFEQAGEVKRAPVEKSDLQAVSDADVIQID